MHFVTDCRLGRLTSSQITAGLALAINTSIQGITFQCTNNQLKAVSWLPVFIRSLQENAQFMQTVLYQLSLMMAIT